MTDSTASPRPRKPWLVAVPLLLVIAIAIVWSAFWIYAANRAEREIEAWMAREARLGRIWTCAERTLGGFPFRFELSCREPRLETKGGDPIQFTSSSARAVAQVWAPNHIVAEFQPPAKVVDQASGQTYSARWSLLQMSGVGNLSGQPERFSLQVHDARLDDPRAPLAAPAGANAPTGAPPAALSAKLFEFHARRNPASAGAPDGVDYALGLSGGQSALLDAAGSPGPLDLSLQGTVTAAGDLRPMPVERRLKAWAAAGGVAKLSRLVLTTPSIAATAAGEISLDSAGRLNGRMDLAFAGFPELVNGLGRIGAIPQDLSPIVGALALAGRPTTVEGRKGVSFPLSFAQGVLKLGPLPVGIVPPVF